MPIYTITDAKTGKTLDIRGDRPPTQEEAETIFREQMPEYAGRDVLTEGRRSALTSGRPEGAATEDSPRVSGLRSMMESAAYPRSLTELSQMIVPDAPGGIAGAMHEAGRVGTSLKNAAVHTLDAIAESGGNPLKLGANIAGKVADAIRPVTPTAVPDVPAPAVPPPPVAAETPLALTRRLKAEHLAKLGMTADEAKSAAFPDVVPVAQTTSSAPPKIPIGRGETLAKGAAERTAGQMSQTWVRSDIGLVARRMKLTLTPEQVSAAETLVQKGASPIEAVQQVGGPALELSQRLGLPSEAEALANVAERNRTGRWRGAPSGKQILAKRNPPTP